MSALYRGVCYPTAAQAKREACSAASQSWGAGQSIVTVDCASGTFDGPRMQLCKRIDGGACQMLQVDYPDFPDCGHSGGHDFAKDWFYLVLPIFIVVFFYRRLIALFSSEDK